MKEKDIHLHDLKDQLTGLSMEEQFRRLASIFPGKVVFTTSLGVEDQVITHSIFTNDIDIRVITLDTGRLFRETYDVLSRTTIKYKKKIEVFFPGYEAVEKMVTEKGPYSFYNSVEDRKECCRVRKLIPLDRALTEMKVWVSGIRASQAATEVSSTGWNMMKLRICLNFIPCSTGHLKMSRFL